MNEDQIMALRADTGAKPGTESTIAAGTDESRLPRIPEELSILPVRGFVVFAGRNRAAQIGFAAREQGMGSDLPQFARLSRETLRADAGRAGAGTFDGAQQRERGAT